MAEMLELCKFSPNGKAGEALISRVAFMRDPRAPAAGQSTHLNQQHWLLCHMGLY
jgi:hypothetical protein